MEWMVDVVRSGYDVQAIDYKSWRLKLMKAIDNRTTKITDELEKLVPYFQGNFPGGGIIDTNSITLKELEDKGGIVCPEITGEISRRCLAFLASKGLIPEAEGSKKKRRGSL